VGDKLVSYNGTTYTYTASGQLQSATSAAGTTTYGYDAFGNLISVVLPSGAVIGYVIDGRNRRVGKTVDGQLVAAWLYEDQLRIAAEVDFDASGNVSQVKRFGYGSKQNAPDLMVMQDGTRYRIITDQVGSPRMVTAETGAAIVARMDYDDFGRVVVNTQPGLVPFGFAGGLYDADTSLSRFGVRDYHSVAGRWTAKDPTRFAGGDTNLYGYVVADPVNRADFNGQVSNACANCLTALVACAGALTTCVFGTAYGVNPLSVRVACASAAACSLGFINNCGGACNPSPSPGPPNPSPNGCGGAGGGSAGLPPPGPSGPPPTSPCDPSTTSCP
jgi:RHS repeat-associated protein